MMVSACSCLCFCLFLLFCLSCSLLLCAVSRWGHPRVRAGSVLSRDALLSQLPSPCFRFNQCTFFIGFPYCNFWSAEKFQSGLYFLFLVCSVLCSRATVTLCSAVGPLSAAELCGLPAMVPCSVHCLCLGSKTQGVKKNPVLWHCRDDLESVSSKETGSPGHSFLWLRL